ncbi:MAG: DUF4296 domain-containing protein [Bacteroidetes bacterium]|nr:DUF4296 domain-containing protein [Bacteroidota bacterium]
MKFLPVLACLLFLLSCGERVPDGVIPPEQMQTVLLQLMQTDEYVSDLFARDSTYARDTSKNINTERIRRYRQVFQLNHTDLETFRKSYDYYMANSPKIKEMFDSLNARVSRRNDTVPKPVHGQGINRLKPVPKSSK